MGLLTHGGMEQRGPSMYESMIRRLSPEFRARLITAYPELLNIEDLHDRYEAAVHAIETLVCPIRTEVQLCMDPETAEIISHKRVTY